VKEQLNFEARAVFGNQSSLFGCHSFSDGSKASANKSAILRLRSGLSGGARLVINLKAR
jgi:hypothetical protein